MVNGTELVPGLLDLLHATLHDPQHDPKHDLAHDKGDEKADSEDHGLPVETIELWVQRGGLVEVLPGLLDREAVAGTIRRCAKGAR